MLVLSRREGQKIQIGPDIELVVVQIRGDVVRLGLNAPREVAILREELLQEQEKALRAALPKKAKVRS